VAVTPGPTVPRIAIVAIVLSFALAVAVGILRTVNAEPVERAAEVAGNIAFAIVFAAPALLALLGLRDRPSLLVAAGALDLGLAFVSLNSFIGLVFVPPAVMFFVAAGRMRGAGAGPTRSVAAVIVAVILGAVAFFALSRARTRSAGQGTRRRASRSVWTPTGSFMARPSRWIAATFRRARPRPGARATRSRPRKPSPGHRS